MDGWSLDNSNDAWRNISSINSAIEDSNTPIPGSRSITPGPWHPENTNTPPSEGAASVGTDGRTGKVNLF